MYFALKKLFQKYYDTLWLRETEWILCQQFCFIKYF